MQLFYRKIGEGDPIIILHGFLGLSDNWLPVARELAKDYSVYIPDLRNHGQSGHSNVFNYSALVDDLFEFIVYHKIKEPVIIGHSMGGKIAMNFALRFPEKLKKIVVVDIAMRRYPVAKKQIEMINTLAELDFSGVNSYKELSIFIARYVEGSSMQKLVIKNLRREKGKGFAWKIALESIRKNIDGIYEGVEKYSVVNKESLFIKGGDSDYITDEDIDEIRQSFSKAVFKIIPDANHWVHVDAHDSLVKVIKDFL